MTEDPTRKQEMPSRSTLISDGILPVRPQTWSISATLYS